LKDFGFFGAHHEATTFIPGHSVGEFIALSLTISDGTGQQSIDDGDKRLPEKLVMSSTPPSFIPGGPPKKIQRLAYPITIKWQFNYLDLRHRYRRLRSCQLVGLCKRPCPNKEHKENRNHTSHFWKAPQKTTISVSSDKRIER